MNGLDMNGSDREVDFEALVKGGGSGISNPLAPAATAPVTIDPWEDDGWADNGELDNSTVCLDYGI
jgi:hypothetical protein